MKTIAYFLFLIFIAFSCSQSQGESEFLYDPTVPYPIFDPNEFWLDSFDQRGLQNARVYNDDLYCNTIDVGGESYLYCFDLKTGTVKWRIQVNAYSTQPITIVNDTLIYCSYLGQMQGIDRYGSELWNERYTQPYGSHWVDISEARIKISTPYGAKVSIYKINGELDTIIVDQSLKKQINEYGGRLNYVNKQYHLKYKKWNYTIDVSTPGFRKHKIQIKKYR